MTLKIKIKRNKIKCKKLSSSLFFSKKTVTCHIVCTNVHHNDSIQDNQVQTVINRKAISIRIFTNFRGFFRDNNQIVNGNKRI